MAFGQRGLECLLLFLLVNVLFVMIIGLLPVKSIDELVFNRLLTHCLKLSNMGQRRSFEIELLCWNILDLWKSSLSTVDFLVQL